MDADAPPPTVGHHVIGLGARPRRVGRQQRDVLVLGRGKGMMLGGIALLFLAPLEQRKVENPAKAEHVAVEQAKPLRHLEAQLPQRLGNDVGLVGDNQDQVARLAAARARMSSTSASVRLLVICERRPSSRTAIRTAALPLVPTRASSTSFVERCRQVGAQLGASMALPARRQPRLVEHGTEAGQPRPQVDQLHAKVDVGLVALALQRLVIGETPASAERCGFSTTCVMPKRSRRSTKTTLP